MTLVFAGNAWADMSADALEQEALRERVASMDERLSLLERFKWFGDFRLRYEGKDRDGTNITTNDADGNMDTQRTRIRFRLGAKVHLYDDMDFKFRLSTGGNVATSGNQTLDNTSGQKTVDINLAYLEWRPDPFVFLGGKFGVPFWKSEVVWDSDVTMEGIAEKFVKEFGANTKLALTFAQTVVEETDRVNPNGAVGPADDLWLASYQAMLEQKTDLGKFKVAIAFYDYQNVKGANITNENGNGIDQKNSHVNARDELTTNMRILDVMGEWGLNFMGKPLNLFAEYAQNTDADAPAGNGQLAQDLDTAWQAGFKYGKVKKFLDYEIKAMYRVVQQDAVFYAFADSDFHDGGVNSKGWELGAKVGLRPGLYLDVTHWITEAERGPKYDMTMTQLDLIAKF